MGVRPGDTLRIRSRPDAESRELGGIPPNACDVIVGSPCRGLLVPGHLSRHPRLVQRQLPPATVAAVKSSLSPLWGGEG